MDKKYMMSNGAMAAVTLIVMTVLFVVMMGAQSIPVQAIVSVIGFCLIVPMLTRVGDKHNG